jgi:hypothetical protein
LNVSDVVDAIAKKVSSDTSLFVTKAIKEMHSSPLTGTDLANALSPLTSKVEALLASDSVPSAQFQMQVDATKREREVATEKLAREQAFFDFTKTESDAVNARLMAGLKYFHESNVTDRDRDREVLKLSITQPRHEACSAVAAPDDIAMCREEKLLRLQIELQKLQNEGRKRSRASLEQDTDEEC